MVVGLMAAIVSLVHLFAAAAIIVLNPAIQNAKYVFNASNQQFVA